MSFGGCRSRTFPYEEIMDEGRGRRSNRGIGDSSAQEMHLRPARPAGGRRTA